MTLDALIQLARRHPLVLGSASPRRSRLLKEVGVDFRQEILQVEEQRRPGENPLEFAQRLAVEKAMAVAAVCGPDEIVLGGDTVVVLGDEVLGKPTDSQDAIRMLELLSGQTHIVGTALALARGMRLLTAGIETTRVIFNQVSQEQIAAYVSSGEPLDKAGAYGIQGMGAFLVDRIEGSLDTVIGLPLTLLNDLAGAIRL